MVLIFQMRLSCKRQHSPSMSNNGDRVSDTRGSSMHTTHDAHRDKLSEILKTSQQSVHSGLQSWNPTESTPQLELGAESLAKGKICTHLHGFGAYFRS